jgi:uncharacterized protein
MNDESRKRAKAALPETDSPCVNICVVHPGEDLCTGCLRTSDEITRWAAMQPHERAEIMSSLPTRARRLKKRRGGRAARLLRRGQAPLIR